MDDDELTPLENLRYERECIEHKEREYLQKKGWNYTCNTPGSIWLYQIKLEDGRTILVSHSTAIHMQEHWDAR